MECDAFAVMERVHVWTAVGNVDLEDVLMATIDVEMRFLDVSQGCATRQSVVVRIAVSVVSRVVSMINRLGIEMGVLNV